MKKQKRILMNLALTGAGLYAGQKLWKKYQQKQRFQKLTTNQEPVIGIPTIFLHSSPRSRRLLDQMINRFESVRWGVKLLEVTIQENGELKIKGDWRNLQQVEHPIIHFFLPDTQVELWQQAQWLKQGLKELKQTFQISEINFVGYAQGASIILRYLEDFDGEEALPRVNKFVSLSAPVKQNEDYRYLNTFRENVPAHLKVLNIYGDKSRTGDRKPVVNSARALGALLADRVSSYQEKILVGQRQPIPENKKVDILIAKFLWL